MRVTKGQLQHKPLRVTTDGTTRPTARRMRETLFEFLAVRIEGAHFLDLCAGTGAVGIEALSRGAAHVTFVEREAQTCALVAANVSACGIVAHAQADIVQDEATRFLHQTDAARAWDIAFFDPPYAIDYAPVLAHFGAGRTLRRKGGVLVVEHHCEHKLDDVLGVLRRWRVMRHGQSCLSFYERKR